MPVISLRILRYALRLGPSAQVAVSSLLRALRYGDRAAADRAWIAVRIAVFEAKQK